MTFVFVRALSAISLSLALGACNSVPESSPTATSASTSSQASPIRLWRSEDGKKRTAFLTIYNDDSAKLFIAHPPTAGVRDRLGYASVERLGDRTFLIFFPSGYAEGYPEIAEIAERPSDHLAIWFHHDIDFEADLFPQLGKLPTDVPPSATRLTRFTF
jgi:hypothetical protein